MQRKYLVWLVALALLLLVPKRVLQQEQPSIQFLPLVQRPRDPSAYPLPAHHISRSGLDGNTLWLSVEHPYSSLAGSPFVTFLARWADRSITLTPPDDADCGSRGGCSWTAALSMEGLVRQQYLIEIEGIDRWGYAAIDRHAYFHDPLPRVSIESPERYDTVAPTVQIRATCTEVAPDYCRAIEVRLENGLVLVRAEGSVLSATLSLEVWAGEVLGFSIVAIDANGQQSNQLGELDTYFREVFVAPPTLRPVAQVPGRILAANATHILYLDTFGYASPTSLKRYDRATGTSTTIWQRSPALTAFPEAIAAPTLFSQGVFFVLYSESHPEGKLYEWREGERQDRGQAPASLQVQGKYAAWDVGPTLYLRDLENEVTKTIFTSDTSFSYTLAPNGDIVFDKYIGDFCHLFRYREGSISQLTPADASWNSYYPVTDGTSILYWKQPAGETRDLMLLGPTGETKLQDEVTSYLITNGWIAYDQLLSYSTPDSLLWRRSPQGVTHSLFPEPGNASLEGLGPNGEIIYHRMTEDRTPGQLLMVLPGQEESPLYLADYLGPSVLTSFWVAEKAYVAVRGTLLEVHQAARP